MTTIENQNSFYNYEENWQVDEKAIEETVNQELRKKTHYYKPTANELKNAFLKAKDNDSLAMENLYQWFLPLVKSISHSYSIYTNLKEDAENICWEQFYIFIKDYEGHDYRRLPGLIKKRLLSRMADVASSRKYCDPLVEYDDSALEECSTAAYDNWNEEIHNMHLKAALQKLDALRQDLIWKRYVDDISGLQTSKELDISYKTYRYHHHKALTELRKYYLEHKQTLENVLS